MPRDEGGFITAEKEREIRDLLWSGHSAHRLVLGQLLELFFFLAGIVVPDESVDKGSVHPCGCHAIAANPLLHVVGRDGASHGEHRPLGHRVGETILQSDVTGDGGEIENHSS